MNSKNETLFNKKTTDQLILGFILGKDIHVAGLLNFLQIAEDLGYSTKYLDTAKTPKQIVKALQQYQPVIVAISYRLSPETAITLLNDLRNSLTTDQLAGTRFFFGGTPATAKIARKMSMFEQVFQGGESREDIIELLTHSHKRANMKFADNLIDRIKDKKPILRHHFGLPSLEDTIKGVEVLAESKLLDIISIGPDQDAQEYFFHPEKQTSERKGDGGVPLRHPDDLSRIYQASRTGNYPLLRCYAGTNDIQKMASMYLETISNAWCAIPLMWYNVLDNRSQRLLKQSIAENQSLMRWHAERDVPVEVNESHHWSLRRAPDQIAVAMAYIAAYNAKVMGVKNYVSQYMFNTPGDTSPKMDLAKMLAKIELIESLHSRDFQSFREVRTGLLSFPPDLDMAKGQLAASMYLALNIDPDIVHVVAYCEGSHITTPTEIIESCKLVQQIINIYQSGVPNMSLDPDVIKRKEELIKEAKYLIAAIEDLGRTRDPLIEPAALSKAVEVGLLDAPDLQGNKFAQGSIISQQINGAYYAVSPQTKTIIKEEDRIAQLIQ